MGNKVGGDALIAGVWFDPPVACLQSDRCQGVGRGGRWQEIGVTGRECGVGEGTEG